MKHFSLILLSVFLCLPSYLLAQKELRPYKAKLFMINGKVIKGFLFSINREELILINDLENSVITDTINITGVRKITLRKKGKVGRTILFSSLAGGVSLGVISRVSNNANDQIGVIGSDEAAVTMGAVGGIILGAVAGTFIGLTPNKTYKINGSQPLFDKYFADLKTKCLSQQAVPNSQGRSE